jgi:hypothetical protein
VAIQSMSGFHHVRQHVGDGAHLRRLALPAGLLSRSPRRCWSWASTSTRGRVCARACRAATSCSSPRTRPSMSTVRAPIVTQRALSVTQRALSVTQRAPSVTQRALGAPPVVMRERLTALRALQSGASTRYLYHLVPSQGRRAYSPTTRAQRCSRLRSCTPRQRAAGRC